MSLWEVSLGIYFSVVKFKTRYNTHRKFTLLAHVCCCFPPTSPFFAAHYTFCLCLLSAGCAGHVIGEVAFSKPSLRREWTSNTSKADSRAL